MPIAILCYFDFEHYIFNENLPKQQRHQERHNFAYAFPTNDILYAVFFQSIQVYQ